MNDRVDYSFFSEEKRVILTLSRRTVYKSEEPSQYPQSEILAVTEGTADIDINGRLINVSEGDVLFFDSMQPHRIAKADKPLYILSARFDMRAFINEDYKVFSKSSLDRFFTQIKAAGGKIDNDTPTAKKLCDALYDLEEELSALSPDSYCVVKALVILMFSLVVRHFNEGFDSNGMQKIRHYVEVQKTMVYINENLSSDLTLDDLAKIANMNRTYYSTVFKKVTGMTVWEYILNARVELAISYLVKDNAEYSITEILGLCGFNNATAFNKTFKKVTGKTPTEFKNSKYNLCF